jgi:hypothetical protein
MQKEIRADYESEGGPWEIDVFPGDPSWVVEDQTSSKQVSKIKFKIETTDTGTKVHILIKLFPSIPPLAHLDLTCQYLETQNEN